MTGTNYEDLVYSPDLGCYIFRVTREAPPRGATSIAMAPGA
jgi:hypothetical protein